MTFNDLMDRLDVRAPREAIMIEPDGRRMYRLPDQPHGRLISLEGVRPIPLDLIGYAVFECPVEGGTVRIAGMELEYNHMPSYTSCLASFRPS